ncbi:MAG: hypothetical protein ACI4QV_04620 [Acutalibacteraceae bacterium]
MKYGQRRFSALFTDFIGKGEYAGTMTFKSAVNNRVAFWFLNKIKVFSAIQFVSLSSNIPKNKALHHEVLCFYPIRRIGM